MLKLKSRANQNNIQLLKFAKFTIEHIYIE